MLYLGYKMDVYEAKQYGLVSEVYKHDSLEEVWDYLNIFLKLSSEVLLLILIFFSKTIAIDIFTLLSHNNEIN